MARAVFGLSAEDVERLQQAIMSYGDGAEKVINNYLKNEASNIFTQAIINYIPVSNRDKQHAKDSSPLKAEQKENLSLYIHTIQLFVFSTGSRRSTLPRQSSE